MSGSEKDADGFERRDVEQTLAAMLEADQFATSAQLSDFLEFIVTKTLDDEQEAIKAYSIAVDALGRGEDFDPQSNAAVRVAAGRLRQALTLFNASPQAEKLPVRIVLEPGSYVPAFVPNTSATAMGVEQEARAQKADQNETLPQVQSPRRGLQAIPRQPARLSVTMLLAGFGAAVLLALAVFGMINLSRQLMEQEPARAPQPSSSAQPGQTVQQETASVRPRIMATFLVPDSPYPNWLKIGEIADALDVTIARFDDYEFLGVRQSETVPLVDDREADYHLVLTAYRRDDNVRFFARLIRQSDGTIIWSTERLLDRPEDLTTRDVPEILGEAFSPIGSPYGVIHADIAAGNLARPAVQCVIRVYQYFDSPTNSGHQEARACAEDLVAQEVKSPTIYALLTFLHLDTLRSGRNPRDNENPLREADKAADKAIKRGPQSPRAYEALFAVRKVQGNVVGARVAAERALALNPYDTDIIADYAAWLISIGDVEKGQELFQRVRGLMDARPAWMEFYMFLGADLEGNTSAADDVAMRMDPSRSPLLAVAVAISAHRRGASEEAQGALEKLVEAAPGFATDPEQEFLVRGFAQSVADRLVNQLRQSGLQDTP